MTACNKTMPGSYRETLTSGCFFEISLYLQKRFFHLLNICVQTADDIPDGMIFILNESKTVEDHSEIIHRQRDIKKPAGTFGQAGCHT